MRSIEAHCANTVSASAFGDDAPAALQAALNKPANDVWQRVALPASRGLLAHARGDYAPAVDELGTALPRLMEIGGSHAQRDLFEQIHLDALMRSGRWSAAQQTLQPRLNSQPQSQRLRRQAGLVYSQLALEPFPM